ncbi:serine hydrolase [Peribacillus simplex]|uniref:serine hydrolase n=1 Tax=Peribacillus simplex TaxID=1478 RepID=UPI0025A183A3|nr:serine hydrolase [Peribacillus simplex]MDM5291778.1 serine hydrolase [Peribacillus simplex]
MRKKRVSKVLAVTLSTSLAVTYLIALVGGYSVSTEQLPLKGQTITAIQPAAVPTAPSGPVDPKEVEAFADNYFGESLKKFNVPGAMFVVVQDGQVVLSKGYGYANKESKTPVDSNTVFRIGSISKTLTAAAVLQLADQGKIKLDQDIQSYLGGITIPNSTGIPLTMENMLTHMTGFDFPYEKDDDASPDLLNQENSLRDFLMDRMPTIVRTPGEAYQYDDYAFALAGYAVEQVTGLPFHEYMDKNIFQPLGMNSSHDLVTPELKARMAAAYDPEGTPYPEYGLYPTDMPQGGMLSTGSDMAKFMTMLLQKGKAGDRQMLSEQSVQRMSKFSVFAHPAIPITSYGFESIFNELSNGQYVVSKGGNIPGHASFTWLLPERKTGMFVIYNNDSELRSDLYAAFMDHYYPKSTKTPESVSPLTEQQAARYVGLYKDLHTPSFVTRITYNNGQLVAEDRYKLGNSKTTLKKIDPLLFMDDHGKKIAFIEQKDGGIANMYRPAKSPIAYSPKIQEKALFFDVSKESPYQPSIEKLHSLDIINGRDGRSFDPKAPMTRAEFITMLLHAVGYPPSKSKSGYTDIEHHFAVKEIQAAVEQHWLGEETGGRFEPDRTITREEMAVILTRIPLPWPLGDEVRLAGQTDESAIKAVSKLVAAGVTDPVTITNSDGSVDFRSKAPLLRQEASYFIDKILFVP